MTQDLLHETDDQLREAAVKRLKARREFKGHALAYLATNIMLVGIWYATGHGFFWPVFVMLGWGIGVVMHGWDTYAPEAGPDEIAAEMDKMRRRGGNR